MFIGHTAVGFASKRLAPRTSLGWLMAAPMLLDFLWPLFLLAGVERVQIRRGVTAMNRAATLASVLSPQSSVLIIRYRRMSAFVELS